MAATLCDRMQQPSSIPFSGVIDVTVDTDSDGDERSNLDIALPSTGNDVTAGYHSPEAVFEASQEFAQQFGVEPPSPMVCIESPSSSLCNLDGELEEDAAIPAPPAPSSTPSPPPAITYPRERQMKVIAPKPEHERIRRVRRNEERSASPVATAAAAVAPLPTAVKAEPARMKRKAVSFANEETHVRPHCGGLSFMDVVHNQALQKQQQKQQQQHYQQAPSRVVEPAATRRRVTPAEEDDSIRYFPSQEIVPLVPPVRRSAEHHPHSSPAQQQPGQFSYQPHKSPSASPPPAAPKPHVLRSGVHVVDTLAPKEPSKRQQMVDSIAEQAVRFCTGPLGDWPESVPSLPPVTYASKELYAMECANQSMPVLKCALFDSRMKAIQDEGVACTIVEAQEYNSQFWFRVKTAGNVFHIHHIVKLRSKPEDIGMAAFVCGEETDGSLILHSWLSRSKYNEQRRWLLDAMRNTAHWRMKKAGNISQAVAELKAAGEFRDGPSTLVPLTAPAAAAALPAVSAQSIQGKLAGVPDTDRKYVSAVCAALQHTSGIVLTDMGTELARLNSVISGALAVNFHRILVCCNSPKSANELCSWLSQHMRPESFVLVSSEIRTSPFSLTQRAKLTGQSKADIVGQARIIVIATMDRSPDRYLYDQKFSLVIVHRACLFYEHSTLVPLMRCSRVALLCGRMEAPEKPQSMFARLLKLSVRCIDWKKY